VEAIEGTDNLIKRCGPLRLNKAPSGILVKIAKPQQEERVDLPTVGPQTMQNLKEQGFKGLALEAGRTLFLKKAEVIKRADQEGLFILGIYPTHFTSS